MLTTHTKDNLDLNAPCPCGSASTYGQCCHKIQQNPVNAATPEQLMRSRYTAFTLRDADYLIKTLHPSKRDPESKNRLISDFQNDAGNFQWLGLEIVEVTDQEVEFIARYRRGGETPSALQERSNFIFEDNQWFYVDGRHKIVAPPERNAPCWCNSGKKAKKCCFR